MGVELQHLKKMANQIAENFSFHADATERVADHIKRFWAPPMRRQLQEYLEEGGEGLSEEVLAALQILRTD